MHWQKFTLRAFASQSSDSDGEKEFNILRGEVASTTAQDDYDKNHVFIGIESDDEDGALKIDLENFDIKNPQLLQELRQFCHFYQIPYLDHNPMKTSMNAAKIYYNLSIDNIPIHQNFKNSQVVSFLHFLSQAQQDGEI
jgi:hypothetical protein